MTAEKLHDAIGLLPADLVAETDAKRTGKPKVIPWKRFASIAACLTLLLLGAGALQKTLLPQKWKAAVTAENISPALAAQPETARDEDVPAGNQGQNAGQVPASGTSGGSAARNESGHDRKSAAPEAPEDTAKDPSANTAAPSDLELRSGGASLSLSPSSYTWTVENPDGTANTVCACGAAPTDDFDRLPLLEAPEASVTLSWDTPPESVTARCWAEKDSQPQPAEAENGVLTLSRSAYIYEVTATWPQGTASYVFRAEIARENG